VIDWTESRPAEVGCDDAGLARVLELARARGATAQLCVIRDGRVVLDRVIGCAPEALFWTFSASKPFVAMLVHLLAERGELSLDEPVATYWPEFGRHGKAGITVRHVLQHRSGVPVARSALGDALAMTSWNRSVHRIERARPRWPAGQAPGYQFLCYGFILGELVQRVTGVPVRDLLGTELLTPLGLRDTYLGLPDDVWSRRVPLRMTGPRGRIAQTYLNLRSTRRAVIPAAGVSTTARDLAAFYLVLMDGGERDGVRVLRPETIAQARTPSSDGEVDRYAGFQIRWSQGFQLGGPGSDPHVIRPMGRMTSPETFGHNGSNCCLAWADPTRQLVFVYLNNLLTTRREDARHQSAVSDAVVAACRG
jgi:CubicO group peptidase (beta-lactamase class C family)